MEREHDKTQAHLAQDFAAQGQRGVTVLALIVVDRKSCGGGWGLGGGEGGW